MKKLLHIGVNAGTESLPNYFKQACDYDEILLNGYTKENINSLNYVPDIVFLQIQNDTINGQNTCQFIGSEIKYLRDQGAVVINWTGDKRRGIPRWMIDFHQYVSITGFSNEEDCKEAHKRGMRNVFIQQGIDTDIYNPNGEFYNVPDIVFMANNYGHFPLSRDRQILSDKLKAHFGERYGVYGNGWRYASGNYNHDQREEAKAYRGCKIAMSMSHFNSDRYFSDRLGRALCSGAFVLSHHYIGIEKDFEIGVHLDTFDLNNIIDKCNYWLEEDERRRAVSENGTELAMKELSYKKMVEEILNIK